LGQEAVDQREDLGRLVGEALADRLVGGEARQIDGVAVDDDLAHPRPGIDTLYGHRESCGWSLNWRDLVRASRPIAASCAGLTRASRLSGHSAFPRGMAGTSPAMTGVGSIVPRTASRRGGRTARRR